MVSKTKIEKKAKRKTNTKLKELIIKLKKQNLLKLANMLAQPRKKKITANIEKINNETKEGDRIIVPGKVLGKGEMNHSITIAAYAFSADARKKLKLCKIAGIEEIASDKNVKIIC